MLFVVHSSQSIQLDGTATQSLEVCHIEWILPTVSLHNCPIVYSCQTFVASDN